MRVAHIVGTRPQFVKLAALYPHLPGNIYHTGQHSGIMSDPFFAEFNLPTPRPLSELSGDIAIVYGDCRSTFQGAIAALRANMKIAHVEAGLRCGDLTMPEELYRICVDHMSDYLFATEPSAVENLRREQAKGEIHLVGNVMIDTLLPYRYGLLTLHRPFNVDDPIKLTAILEAVFRSGLKFIWPCHPRVGMGGPGCANIERITPLSRGAFIELLRGAAVVVTDSGGVQEEAAWLGRPCLTLRPSTERPITLAHKNKLTTLAALTDDISAALPDISLWDGHAAERIASILRK
jgi:UDP-N-acetylglucosamine 2-epimerase (non-hydrolysing)